MGHAVDEHGGAGVIDRAIAQQVADVMQALATPSRVLILGRLREGACTVNVIAEAVGMEASAVSHQLRLLRHLGLVVGERQGRTVLYALHDSHVGVLLDEAVYHVEHIRFDFPERVSMKGARSG